MPDSKFISKSAYDLVVGELIRIKLCQPVRYVQNEDGTLEPWPDPKKSEVEELVGYLLGGLRRLPKEVDKPITQETVPSVCHAEKENESPEGKTLGQIGGAFLGK